MRFFKELSIINYKIISSMLSIRVWFGIVTIITIIIVIILCKRK